MTALYAVAAIGFASALALIIVALGHAPTDDPPRPPPKNRRRP